MTVAKVLKEMMCALYQKPPDALRELTLVGFLLFDTKFTMILCDLSAGYVCPINHTKTIDLPEETDYICNELLSILKTLYQDRLMMESTNRLDKQKLVDTDVDLEQYKTILPSFTAKGSKKKTRRNGDSTKE
ncbi:hypothetical protein RMCBS344292_06767 [Rhizopus microsporus]|nr:hypothetical protein RMCBS344292_06767 [Rhizopus microsporus]